MLLLWTSAGDSHLITAISYDAAYEKAISIRMENEQDREEAEGWFRHNDSLIEVDGYVGSRSDIDDELAKMT